MRKRLPGTILLLSFGLWAQKIEPPSIRTEIQPEYPPDLKYFLVDHPVVQLSIDDKGVPFALQSTLQVPQNVVSAIRQWRFEPARQGNHPVAVAISITAPIRRPLTEALGLRRRWTSTEAMNTAWKTAKDLDESGALAIDQKIAQSPNDVQSRLVAVRYAALHESTASATARLRQVRWFSEISPRFELLGTPEATPRHEQAATEDYEAVRKLWVQKLTENQSDTLADTVLLDNATNFLRVADPEASEAALIKVTKDRDHAVELLGELYAFAASGVTAVDPIDGTVSARDVQMASTSFAVKARETLLKTDNMRLLFSALNAVRGGSDAAFCGVLLERAKDFFADATEKCERATPGPLGTVRVGGQVQQANLLKQPRPTYPPEAKTRGITGTVKFEARIGRDGKIHDLELLSGNLALYDSARAAVEKWEYRPTRLNGEPVEVITTIDVNYTLQ